MDVDGNENDPYFHMGKIRRISAPLRNPTITDIK